jgi:hypothetical protein
MVDGQSRSISELPAPRDSTPLLSSRQDGLYDSDEPTGQPVRHLGVVSAVFLILNRVIGTGSMLNFDLFVN